MNQLLHEPYSTLLTTQPPMFLKAEGRNQWEVWLARQGSLSCRVK